MNSRVMALLDRQEQEEQIAYRSEALLRNMIGQDFADADGLLRLFDALGDGVLSLVSFANLSGLLRKIVIPVRTGSVFSIHKHTLCQVSYFHSHDFYELIYVVRGTCRQEFDALPEPLILREKQACLLEPGVVHAISRCGEGDLILKFTIPPALFSKTAEPVLSHGPASGTGITLFQAQDGQTDYLVTRLMLECCSQEPFWESAVEHYLSLLFIALVRGPEYNANDLLLRLAAYFDGDPAGATLRGFASFIGYSEHHAARLLKRYTGRSFTEQIVALKMERARTLLSSTDAAVADIAAALGYANASGFHKQFLSATGMTPAAYRKLMGQGNGL